MKIDIPLFGEQNTVLADWLTTDKHCIDIVPVGSGKTFLAAIALPIFASDPRYHRGKDIIYSAPTGAMIKSLIWEPLKQSCINYFGLVDGKDINNSELTIKFPNGVFIRCKSAEQRENLRGLNVGVWVADEAALYTQDTLQEITNRLRPKVGQPETAGRLIVISTPNGAGPLYELFKFAMERPDKYVVRHFNYLQMRSGNREFIEEQKRIISPLKFQQDYMCSFENVADQFFYAWDKNKYTVDNIVDRGGELYTFHDWNKRVMCAAVAQVTNPYTKDGKIEILKSYAIRDCGTEGIAQAIRQDFPKRRISSIIDMSGTQTNRDTTSPFGVTDRTIIEQYGFTVINNRKSNPLIADTDNTSNAFISRGGLVVKKDDKFLLEALQTYHFEDATRKNLVKYTEQKYAHIDGLGDCIRYGIHYLFPIQHESTGIAEYVGMDSRLSRRMRPGVEHMPDSPLYPGGPSWEEILNGDETEKDFMTWG
jgi:hypothetical protein